MANATLNELAKEMAAKARDYVFLEGPATYTVTINKIATGTSSQGSEYFSIDATVNEANGATATPVGSAIRIGFKERPSKFGKASALKQMLKDINAFLAATLNVPPAKIPTDISSLGTDKQPLAGLQVRVSVETETNPKSGKTFSVYKFSPV